MTPSWSASTGLRSSSRTSGRSAASCASLTSTSATASVVRSRHVAIGLEVRATRGCARSARARASRSSGGSASALSSMTSTAVPPRPNTTTGPKVGSSAIPAISSRAFGRTIIGWMVTPVMRASGLLLRARARISATASRTARSLVRLSRTPPTSDLCTMSGDRIFATTVDPSASSGAATAAASSGSRASSAGAIGME